MPATSLGDLYLQKLQLMLEAEAAGHRRDASASRRCVHDAKLRDTLQTHRSQSQEHVSPARAVDRDAWTAPCANRECVSMRALIEEAQGTLATIEDPDTIDAFVIGAQQAIEHYEIAAYGTARSWAQQLGFDDDANVLQKTLDEEGDADELLSRIADGAGERARGTGRRARGRDRERRPRGSVAAVVNSRRAA